jgi:6-phosphofructokinase 2
MIGTVTINPSIDQHIVIDKLIKDDTLKAREIWRDPGGKGINVSRVIQELRGETIAFGIAGGCGGYMLKSLMAERQIKFECVEVVGETRINVIVTDRSDRTQTRISVPGPRMTLADIEQFMDKIANVKSFPDWWVLGGSLPADVPQDFYGRMIHILQKQGAKCLLDTDNEALRIGIESKPYLIKPNEYEFSRLMGREFPDEASLIKAAQEIINRGVKMVALTLGRKGALVVTKDQAFKALTPSVEVKSKVGAGDSFLAGCVLSLSRNGSLEEVIRLGMAAGTAAVMNEGTRLCKSEDIEKILPQIKIEKLKISKGPESVPKIALVRDVVCGMEIDPAVASFESLYQGQTYKFCSLMCQQKFKDNPRHFLAL